MNTLFSGRNAIVGFAALCWFGGFGIVSAVEVDITQPPYSATPGNPGPLDNGTIINQAIHDVRAQGGGTVYIPQGNWNYRTPISITNDNTLGTGAVVIRGDGSHIGARWGGTNLIFHTTGAVDAFTVDGSGGGNIPRMVIRDLSIDGPSSVAPPTFQDGKYIYGNRHGLVLRQTTNFEVSGLEISGFASDAILVDTCSYGAFRDMDIIYNGIGVDCIGTNKGLQLDGVNVDRCTNGFRNPPQMIGCEAEACTGDAVVYNSNSPLYVSLHDSYFEGNNSADTAEGADIHGTSPSVSLSLSGMSTFHFGATQFAYRRVWGGFATFLRTGNTYWQDTPVLNSSSFWAAWDVTNTKYLDDGINSYPSHYPGTYYYIEGWTAATGNSYIWRGIDPQTIDDIEP